MSHAAFTIRELPDGGACRPGMETGLPPDPRKAAERNLSDGISCVIIENAPGFRMKTGVFFSLQSLFLLVLGLQEHGRDFQDNFSGHSRCC